MQMSRWRLFVPLCFLIPLGLLACSDDGGSTQPPPEPGRVTVEIEAIPGQVGKVVAIMAYSFDWAPGAQEPAVAALGASIAEENFTFTGTLEALNENGQPTGQPKVFDSGVYSVVFFVSDPDQPPSAYAEIRASVDGDITVTAPVWTEWQHTQ
jgi:hypothetical protein